MSVTDELLQNNAAYAENLEKGNLPLPAKGVALVACIDFRLNVYGMLRLQEGGACDPERRRVITDDEIRSLAISQRLLGTRESSSSTTPATPTSAAWFWGRWWRRWQARATRNTFAM